MPYVLFAHAAASMTLAPDPGDVTWRFDEDSVRGARDVYTAVEDMPVVEGSQVSGLMSSYMRLRRAVRDAAPSLLVDLGPFEAWQGIGWAMVAAASLALGTVLPFRIIHRTVQDRTPSAARDRKLRLVE